MVESVIIAILSIHLSALKGKQSDGLQMFLFHYFCTTRKSRK